MLKYVAKRAFVAVLTLFAIIFILFLLMDLLPGSPFNDEKLTENQKVLLMEKYGLDKPFFTRFGVYLRNLSQGDFGVSYVITVDMPVSKMLATRLPLTARIGLQAMVLGVIVGLMWGILAALKKNTWVDTTATVFSVLGFSVPSYVCALLLVFFVAFKLKWFPIQYSLKYPFYSSILPTISLAVFITATMARYARSEMIECLNSDYILLVKAKGVRQSRVVIHHALRNTLVPIITVIAPLMIGLITGSVVVEQIFGVPGLGQLLLSGVQNNDYNVIVAVALVYSFLYIVIMLAVDILYGLIDPRIRVAGEKQ
jgi:ABC-type dipeptide/oligopeptide/nickel transport systems, permease components